MTQHADLTLERRRSFDPDRRVLMIANEVHRGRRLREPEASRRGERSFQSPNGGSGA